MGRQLQQQEGAAPQVVITTPLLVGLSGPDPDGPKMSKSLGNYVGLAEPAGEQFGKLMSIPDTLLDTYAQHATGWPQSDVDAFVAARRDGSLHPNAAKRRVAAAVVDLYHGAGAGAAAEAEFDRVHKRHEAPSTVDEYPVDAASASPDGTVSLGRLLVASGLASSAREAQRFIASGAVRIDGEVAAGDAARTPQEWSGTLIQVGRRRWVRLVGP